jgi:hypothetical protein
MELAAGGMELVNAGVEPINAEVELGNGTREPGTEIFFRLPLISENTDVSSICH